MSLHYCRLVVALLIAFTLVGSAIAQETPAGTESSAAEEEKTYHDLRRSKNRATKSAADRYFYLVRAQEWTSLNGKKVVAKYVAHDPNLKWVKLSAVKGSGPNRVTREVTVDVAKLSKACQSRVKQIDTLQKKLDELKVKEEEGDSEQASGEGLGGYGAPMRDERGAEPAQTDQPPLPDPTSTDGDRGADDRGVGGYGPPSSTPAPAPAAQTPPADSSDPDPLGFGEVANEPPPAASTDERGGIGPPSFFGPIGGAPPAAPAAGADADGRVERSQWKTSYAAFLANFTATPVEQGEPTIDWGELDELRSMHEAVVLNPDQGVRDRYGRPAAARTEQPPIEVRWEAPFAGMAKDAAEPEVQFDLPPLPEPLKLRFVLDVTELPEQWSEMPPNQKVAFTGRLEIKQSHEIIVRVRLSE